MPTNSLLKYIKMLNIFTQFTTKIQKHKQNSKTINKIYNKQNIKAISLVEVLMSIMLLTLVIGAVFKIKDSNLEFLERFSKSQQFNTYVAFAISDYKKEIKNENIYLDEIVDFGDDYIRQKLKLIKVIRKDKEGKSTTLGDDFSLTYKIKKSIYKIGDSHQSILYTISIE
jgi:hypothetical protein